MRFRRRRSRLAASPLSRADLEAADDPVYLVIERLIRSVHSVPDEQQVDFVRSLPLGQRTVWGTFMVEGEVNNGGFNQFFFNSSHRYVDVARDGYAQIGATDHLALLDEAVGRFEREGHRLQPFFDAGTIESFSESYSEGIFDDLDRRFFELNSSDRLADFIRSRIDDFIGME